MPLFRVGEIADQLRGVSYGKTDAVTEVEEGYLPVLRAGNITDSGLVFDNLVFVPAELVSSKQRIRRGDVVIAASSGSLDVVGKAAMAKFDYDGGFGAFCKVLRPNPDKVEPAYFAHYFQTREYRNKVSSLAAGANINNLRNEHLDDLLIPLPPISEQRRIAAILDQADALRAKRREALAELDKLSQAIFIEMFGDPDRPSPDKQLLPLGAYCDLFNGYAFKSTDYVEESSTLNCRMSNIRPNGEFDVDYNPRYLPDHFSETHKEFLLRDGDIIIAMTDMASEPKILGVPTIVNSKGKTLLLNQRVGKLVIKAPEKLRVAFLKNLLSQQYARKYLQKFGGGGVQINLGKSDLLSVPIFAPSAEKQDLFGERLDGVDALRYSIQKSMAEHDALFSSLQHCAFRGDL